MRRHVLLLAILGLGFGSLMAQGQVDEKPPQHQKCAELLERGLSSSEVFILQVANRIREYGKLPEAGTATYRLVSLSGREMFEDVLKKYKVNFDQWKENEDIALDTASVLGTHAFITSLDKVRVRPRVKLTEDQIEFFSRLNMAADQAREKVKAFLVALEEDSLINRHRFLTEVELTECLRQYTQGAKNQLSQFISVAEGDSLMTEWRYRLLIERDKLAKTLKKDLVKELKEAVQTSREIPESAEDILKIISAKLNISLAEAAEFFGPRKLFDSTDTYIQAAMDAFPDSFSGIIDRRVYSKVRNENMLKALRDSSNVILFKLAENQDIGNWAEIEQLAESLDAPIIVAPAFSEVNLIISRLAFLFKHPRVHIMVDQQLQLTKDFYIVNNGAPDKTVTPEARLDQVFDPTDRVILFHPRVRTTPRASGYYTTQTGYFMTSGSMSNPSYRSEWNVGMPTDFAAQEEAELNRGLTILSRRYKNESLGGLTGAAFGVAPRRALFTEAKYGNPAGLFDMNHVYAADGAHKVEAIPGLVLGDIHLGVTDPAYQKAFFKSLVALGILKKNPLHGQPGQFEFVAGDVKLGTLVFHDLVDGIPFNHHIQDKILSKSLLDEKGFLDIESHFKFAAWFITFLRKLLPDTTILVPVDNHGHDWLVNSLQEATKGQRPKDLPLMLRLMLDTMKGANPYEKILRYYGVDSTGVVFMSNAQQYRIGVDLKSPNPFSVLQGMEVGQHTHQGVSGARSISINSLLGAYKASVGGHVHATAEKGQAKRVGALIPLPSDYHKGPGKSDVSLALVYSETAIQILRMINNTFVPGEETQAADRFFPSEQFPHLKAWPELPEGGKSTDQYRANPPTPRFKR